MVKFPNMETFTIFAKSKDYMPATIIIDGKNYRNLTEQVKKNMDDIKELQDKAGK